MPKISTYSLDTTITDNDSLLGVNAADGTTKRYSMSGIKAAFLAGADITAVIAGTGLSGGATSGEATLTIDSTVVTKTGTETLTNKTLTTPVISSISNTGTLTLPTSSDTLVGRATTDTLTNKTLTSPSLASPTFSVTETGIANGDLILFLDATDSSVTKKEGLDDLATLFAGAGLTAANSVLAVGAGTGITVNANDVAVAGAQTSITSVLNTSLVLGRDADNDIDFTSDNIITLRTAGADQIKLTDGALSPVTDSDVDLGTSSLYFKDAYIDSITTTGNVSIGGTLSVSGNNFSNVADIGLDSISAATNDINIALTDNRAAALTIKQGSDAYMIFDTANSSESVSIGTGISGTAITIGHGTSETTIGDNLVVTGNLTVQGDTTTVNTATLSVEDPLVVVGSGNNSSDSVDLGLYGLYDTSGSQDLYSGLFRDASDSGKWKLFKDLQTEPTTTVNTSGTGYAVGTLVANLEGAVTGNASGLSATLAVASGGTNATSFADKAVIISQDSGTDTLAGVAMSTNGQLLIGGTSGPAAATLTAGNNVTITNADNAITLDVSAAGDAFKTIAVSGEDDIVADGTADTLTLVGGTGTTITTNASSDTITIAAGANVVEINEYTGNGSTTAYTLSSSTVSENELMVYMDGVYQHHNTYAVSGTTLTFDTNVPNGAKVEVYHMRSVNISNMVQSAVAGTLMDVSGATGDVTFNVDLSEAAEAAIADGDYMLFLDGGATGTAKKEALADIATLFAGTGLTASSSVINMDAAQTGITSILNTSLVLGRDADNQIKFGTDNQIIFEVSGGDNVIFKASGEIEATTVNTTGAATIGGNGSSGGVTINDGSIQIRTGTGNVAEMRFYCESSNAHYQTLKAAPHSAGSSAALVLPTASGNLVGTGDSGTVASGMIAADAITGAKIADDAINSEHYTDGSIDTAHIADDQITQAKVANDAIGADELASNAVVNASIVDNAVSYEKIDDEFSTIDALSAGATVAVDFDAAQVFTLTPNANTTFNITNPKIGVTKSIIVTGAGSTYTADTWTVGGASGTFNKITGTYDDTSSTKNFYQITCVSATEFWYSISQIG